ncbi:MAG: glycosyltransferase family 39 protein [Candidatus Eremiobacteraeota bacterium]|nr:glycosyltransferase family 39 protein [Candidatus Eremiobacteraeota bacterium]
MLRLHAIGGPVRAALIGAVAAALIVLPALGAGTLWDNSETAYGEVAREILLTHDWVIMHLNNAPYFVQPPLYFWIGALFAMQFGVTAFALRLSSALATIALSAFTGYAVARQGGGRVGAYAAVILSTCLMQVVIGRLAIMDALLDLTVAMTIFWWFRGLETGRDRYFVFGWIAAGIGFLAKGLVAPVAALLVIVPFYLWNRRCEPTNLPSGRGWVFGLAAFFAIVVPWPAAVAQHSGLSALQTLLGEYTVGRYLGVIENQSGPLLYYVPVIILAFFPWIAFFPAAVAYAISQLKIDFAGQSQLSRLVRLSFTWIVMPLLFFSFARTKLPNYVALEFPALAAITAIYFDGLVRRGATRSAAISAAIVPVTIGALAFAIWLFTRNNRLTAEVAAAVPPLVGMALAVFAGSVLTAWLVAHARTVRAAPYALAVACIVAVDVVAVTVFPHAEVFKPVPRLAALIDRQRQPGDVVAIQGVSGGNALLFYTRPEVRVLAPPNDGDPQSGALDPRSVICGAPRAWVVAPASHALEDPTYGRHRRIVAVDRTAALLLYYGGPCPPNT